MKPEHEQRDAKQFWFPAKTCGWGWGPPRCWQGWVVMAVYLAALVVGAVLILRKTERAPILVGYSLGLSVLLCLVCWWKGEKPEWRWGKKTPGREAHTSR